MKAIWTTVAAAALAAGCGSGGGGISGVATQSVGGAWVGTFTQGTTTDNVQGVIDEAGRGYFLDTSNGVIYRLSAGANGDAIAGSFRAFAPSGFQFANGSTFLDGTIAGTAQQRLRLSGTTSSAAGGNSTFVVNYDRAAYELAASFATIAGTYGFATANDTVTITISNSGAVTGSTTQGCTLNGSVTVVNPTFNAYRFAASAVCPGAAAQNVTGLASFLPATSTSVARLLLAYDDNSSATFVAATRQ